MREKLKDFIDSYYLSPVLYILAFILVLVGISTGFFEELVGVDNGKNKQVIETVTYRVEDKIHPIYISTENSLPKDSQGLGFLLKDLDSDIPSNSKYTDDSIVVSIKRGYDDRTRKGSILRLDRRYLFLYNTESNTYKSIPVTHFEKRSNKDELKQQLKEKYGYAYDYLHVKYEPDNSITLSYLEGGSARVFLNENVKVANQEEIDKAYKEAPQAE